MALSSGLVWAVFKGRLVEDKRFQFQSHFAEMAQAKRNILIIGNPVFVKSTAQLLKKQTYTYYSVDAQHFQLTDLLLSIEGITIDEFDVIVAQSSPQFWTNINHTDRQDLRLWRYQRKHDFSYFDIKSPPLFWSMFKKWLQAKDHSNTAQQPALLYNASFEFPPIGTKNIWKRIEKKNVKNIPHIIWLKFIPENLVGTTPELKDAFNTLHETQGNSSKQMSFIKSDSLVFELEERFGS